VQQDKKKKIVGPDKRKRNAKTQLRYTKNNQITHAKRQEKYFLIVSVKRGNPNAYTCSKSAIMKNYIIYVPKIQINTKEAESSKILIQIYREKTTTKFLFIN